MWNVRENISCDFLKENNVEAHLYPDLGFFLKPSERDMSDYLTKRGVPLHQKKVAITLRPYRFQGFNDAEKLFSNYINGCVALANFLYGKGYHITFMAHTLGPSSHEDDRIAIKEVRDALSDEVLKGSSYIEDFDLTCREIEKIYSYYDYMVGTRFHSVIFSLNVGVPAIAIAYGGNKSKGIMNVLGNGNYSIDMDKVDGDKLIELFSSLEANRKDYVDNLRDKQNELVEQRDSLVKTIRELQGDK